VDLIQALIMGLVQGLTEFLPISSSAHLLIVPWLFGWSDDKAITSIPFDVALHMGTLLAVLIYFAADWRRLIVAGARSAVERRIGDDPDRRLAWLIVIASVPAALVGVLGESKIDEIFHKRENLEVGLYVIAVMMIVMGLLLFAAERLGKRLLEITDIRLPTALTVGLAQALALIPGVSRSGSTITAGLFRGLKREAAARFSFLLATPIVLAAGAKKLYDVLKSPEGIQATDQVGYLVGFAASAISGFLCIYFLMRYLQRRSTAPFIAYRLLLGVGIIVLLLMRFHI
jgi:undecaprenyl-diphosphatase